MTETTPSDSPMDWIADHTRRYLDSDGADGHLWHGIDGSLTQGAPTLLLTTRGRRSGKLRRTPLIYGRDGNDYVIVASKAGFPEHPLWYLNLLAHPEVELQVGAERFPAKARVAEPAEKARLWPTMTALWPDYDGYQSSTDRDIPIVLLERI
ncbi:nitroreductase [Frankia sp. CcI49]|uniref:nitroreductase family deazaflavin-dependent oxidoreductase n=1 Tax=Frankia sp. CcI49 TaxID=1745382 RepID=UPI000975F9FB|nr:nitroreductase family deazaflavin-dependent oxidoreductase [Frankia sp. CcI49]ONH59759.1 nitroreductase [Frankia sp. CcI49]